MNTNIDPNDLLDLIEDLGLSEEQQIGTLLKAVEDSLDGDMDEEAEGD